jgi:hypothetical protein
MSFEADMKPPIPTFLASKVAGTDTVSASPNKECAIIASTDLCKVYGVLAGSISDKELLPIILHVFLTQRFVCG